VSTLQKGAQNHGPSPFQMSLLDEDLELNLGLARHRQHGHFFLEQL
jgi:hypothetical protein